MEQEDTGALLHAEGAAHKESDHLGREPENPRRVFEGPSP